MIFVSLFVLLFFLRIITTTLNLLFFYMNFRINFSTSTKNPIRIYIRIFSDLQINLERMNVFTRVIVWIFEHAACFLLSLSLSFFSSSLPCFLSSFFPSSFPFSSLLLSLPFPIPHSLFTGKYSNLFDVNLLVCVIVAYVSAWILIF